MRRKNSGLIISLFMIMSLSIGLIGCAGTEVFEEKPKKPSPITEVSDNDQDTTDNVQEEEPEEPEVGNNDIPGNGTDFVKVGNKVYFREYDADAMDMSVLWGDLHGNYTDKGKKYIKYFDVNTGDVERAFEDDGYGVLYFYNDRLYLRGTEGWYSVLEDGSDKKNVDLKDDSAVPEKIVNNYLFYTSGGSEAMVLSAVNLDNDEVIKVLPIPLDDELGYPTICQIAVKGDDVYTGISYIAGSGGFHQGGVIYKSSLSGAYEPEPVKNMSSFEEGEEYIYLKADGSYDFGIYAPNSAFMKDSDIWVCNSEGVISCFYRNFISNPRGFIVDYAESLSYIDDSVYLIHNNMRTVKEDDIGWREAYKVFRSSNIRINDKQTVNEFNIVKGKSEEITAYVYYIHETDKNGGTQVLYQPVVMISALDTELCEKFNLDPTNTDQFMEGVHFENPYFSEGFVATVSDNLKFKLVDWYDPSGYRTGGKDDLVQYLLDDPYDMYTMLSLTEMEHDDYMNYYVFREPSGDNGPYYNYVLAKMIFNEDGSEIVSMEEIYIP